MASDSEPSKRCVPMEVLALGLCRTGTQSLSEALKLLGYNDVYHMRNVRPLGHTDHWLKAIEAKYEGKGVKFGRAEFDNFLGDFMAVTDVPPCMFAEDLISAYPAAKVILTVRDENDWAASVDRSLWYAWTRDNTRPRAKDGTVEGNSLQTIPDKMHEHLWKSNFEAYGKECFRVHNEGVKQLMTQNGRQNDLLIYSVKEGWEPLCNFLGKPTPSEDFPQSDDWAQEGWARPKRQES